MISAGSTSEGSSGGSCGGGGGFVSGAGGWSRAGVIDIASASHGATAQESPSQCHLVGVVEVPADGQAGGQPGHRQLQRPQQPREIGGGGLALDVGVQGEDHLVGLPRAQDRKSTRLNSSHVAISYDVFCLI